MTTQLGLYEARGREKEGQADTLKFTRYHHCYFTYKTSYNIVIITIRLFDSQHSNRYIVSSTPLVASRIHPSHQTVHRSDESAPLRCIVNYLESRNYSILRLEGARLRFITLCAR